MLVGATITQPRTGLAFSLWLLAGLLLIAFLPIAPVQRTQEARVLETARQMLGQPAHDWIIPKLNGELRLRKPPLTYWLSAASFELFGVHASTGRLPAAIAGWLTLGVVFLTARRFFTERAALLSALLLLGSYMFFRFTRLAETDALASLFVTAAIALLWAGMREPPQASSDQQRPLSSMLCFHGAAACAALAALSKGPPAIFPLLFLLGATVYDRSLHWRFIKSGAPLTFMILAAPWWGYAWLGPGSAQINRELEMVTLGGEHAQPWFNYFPELLWATAPWTGFVIVALLAGLVHFREDRRVALLLIWLACVFVPLLLVRQRQFHYLLCAMPPLMLLTGWMIDTSLSSRRRDVETVKLLVYVTAAALLCGAPVLIFINTPLAAAQEAVDLVMAGLIVAGAVVTIYITHQRGPARGVWALALATALLIAPLLGYWTPEHFERRPDTEVLVLRQRFGNDKCYYFYGEEISLPLCFAMRSPIVRLDRNEQVPAAVVDDPASVVLVIAKEGRTPAAPPAPFAEAFSMKSDQRVLYAYQAQRSNP